MLISAEKYTSVSD